MAGESIGCTSRKKCKSKQKDDKSDRNDNNGDGPRAAFTKTTRGGLRVYKIVILGDGGVGKSGKSIVWLQCSILLFVEFAKMVNNKNLTQHNTALS